VEAQASGPGVPAARQAYSGSVIASAVIATLVFPVLSLITALFLYGNEQNPQKKRALRTWALGSLGWLVLQAVVALIVFAAVMSGGGIGSGVDRSGPCVGGPEIGASGKDISGNGTRFVVPCAISGTETVAFPPDH
jgi:hypothetical protein